MELINYNGNKWDIKIGDIVKVDGELAILTFTDRPVYIKGGGWDTYKVEFPYVIISLEYGTPINAYKSLESILTEDDVEFIANTRDTKLMVNKEDEFWI